MPVFSFRKPEFKFGVIGEPDTEPKPRRVSKRKPALATPKVLAQTGLHRDILRDAARKALLPGKRLSKSGHVYWETRRNRSDAFKSNL